MRVLGIDPGYAILGYGIVDIKGSKLRPVAYGVITTDKDSDMPSRLKHIYSRLMEIISEHEPDVSAVEELFFNSNAKTAILVGQARGTAVLACINSGLDVHEYTPLQIKQALVGYGRAEKKQVQYMVKTLLNLEEVPKPDDAADAVAAAICHCNSSNMVDELERTKRK